MADGTIGSSPRIEARVAGGLWLIVIVASMVPFFIRSSMYVRGDAVATATNILASESLFRFAFVAELVAGLCYIGVTALLFGLLKPVSASVSMLAAFFGLGGVAIGAATSMNYLASLIPLGGDSFLKAFTTSQLQAQALMSIRLAAQGFSLSMVFFGCHCVLMGCLIAQSSFLPRILGVLLAIGGSTYIISSFISFMSPALANLSLYIMPAALVGEGSLTVWLLLKGVDVPRWQEQSAARFKRRTL